MTAMRTDDQIADVFARANPVPPRAATDATSDLEQPDDQPAVPVAGDGSEVVQIGDSAAVPGDGSHRGSWALVAGVAAVVALVVSLLVTSIRDSGESVPADQPAPSSTHPASESTAPPDVQLAVASEFWQALEAGDRESAVSVVDPGLYELGAGNPYGRARTLEGQFDWYEAVGWRWQLDECARAESELIECTVSASNAWSEALGVGPVAGTFVVRFGDDGIQSANDKLLSFTRTWSRTVFGVFRDWVTTHHPEDAEVMFDSSTDVDPEILALYELNTERFVEAHTS